MSLDVYSAWAPADSPWSAWVKPVLFAHEGVSAAHFAGDPWPTSFPVERLPSRAGDTCIVVDQPGAAAVTLGLALAQRGFRPIPLFNGVDGSAALVPVSDIVRELCNGAAKLNALQLRPNAPPAFLLDAERMTGAVRPRVFDNRWVVVPEDFPSGNRLLAAGIKRCILIADRPMTDLPHVLLRYQRAGIELWEADNQGSLSEHRPIRPSSFGTLFARALVLAGLQRSSAGGFGGYVPEPSQGGHG